MAGGRRGHGQGTFWGDLIGPNPTDRGKAGSKRSLLVEGQGGPLSIVVAGANAHDATLLDETLEAIVVERPQLRRLPKRTGIAISPRFKTGATSANS